MPKPRARRATAVPMAPMPTMPSVAPATARPSSCVGPHTVHPPLRTRRSPSPRRRAAASSRAKARSAVASVSTPGVLVSTTRRALAAGDVHVVEADGQVGDHAQVGGGVEQLVVDPIGQHRQNPVARRARGQQLLARSPVGPRAAGSTSKPAAVQRGGGRRGQGPGDEHRAGRHRRSRIGQVTSRAAHPSGVGLFEQAAWPGRCPPRPWSTGWGGTSWPDGSAGPAGHDPVRRGAAPTCCNSCPLKAGRLPDQPHDALGGHLARLPGRLVDAGGVGHEPFGGHGDVDPEDVGRDPVGRHLPGHVHRGPLERGLGHAVGHQPGIGVQSRHRRHVDDGAAACGRAGAGRPRCMATSGAVALTAMTSS